MEAREEQGKRDSVRRKAGGPSSSRSLLAPSFSPLARNATVRIGPLRRFDSPALARRAPSPCERPVQKVERPFREPPGTGAGQCRSAAYFAGSAQNSFGQFGQQNPITRVPPSEVKTSE